MQILTLSGFKISNVDFAMQTSYVDLIKKIAKDVMFLNSNIENINQYRFLFSSKLVADNIPEFHNHKLQFPLPNS